MKDANYVSLCFFCFFGLFYTMIMYLDCFYAVVFKLTFSMLSRTLVEIIKKSEKNYYQEVDRNEMMEGAIRGAMAALDDPYSFYMEPRKLKREREDLYRGEFGGLGIRIYEDKNHFVKNLSIVCF